MLYGTTDDNKQWKEDPRRWVEVPYDFETVSLLDLGRIAADISNERALEIGVELRANGLLEHQW